MFVKFAKNRFKSSDFFVLHLTRIWINIELYEKSHDYVDFTLNINFNFLDLLK